MIKVGEYVRTKEYGIRKVVYENRDCFLFDGTVINENLTGTIRDCAWLKSDIRLQNIKHSKNIIDLIEVGDYVNGRYVKEIKQYKDGKYILALIGIIGEQDIKTIVTHEQFESIEYKVEEE